MDEPPHELDFTIQDRPENTTLSARTEQESEYFTVDQTNIENGSVVVTGKATGNGTLIIELKDSEQTVIADATIPGAIDITPGINLVWSISGGIREMPYYLLDTTAGTATAGAQLKLYDNALNSINCFELTRKDYNIIDENGVNVVSGEFIAAGSAVQQNTAIQWNATERNKVLAALNGKTSAQIEACKVAVAVEYLGETYTTEANFNYYEKS